MKIWIRHFFSEKTAHIKAFEEVAYVSLFSLFPLLMLPVIENVKSRGSVSGSTFWEAISAGQLYLYSFSLLGTVMWLNAKDKKENVSFTPRKWLETCLLFPAFLILIIYSNDPALSKPLSSFLVKTSIAVYLLYTLLYYIHLVFDKLPTMSLEEAINSDVNELIRRHNEGANR